MIPSKLIIGILSCAKYGKKQDAVRKTWLNDCVRLGVRAYFLVGRPGQKSEAQGDILYLDCGDAYLDLPHKTIAFLRFVEEHFDYDYIYKCDDDTYVNLPSLLNLSIEAYDYCGYQYKDMFLNDKWHQKHVAPHLRNQPYPGTFLGPWMTGGSGYLLSKRALVCAIHEYPKFIDKEFYEDKLIGDIMRTNNMSSKVFLSFKELFGFDKVYIKSLLIWDMSYYVSFHPCSSRQMFWFYKKHNILLIIAFIIRYVFLRIQTICKSLGLNV